MVLTLQQNDLSQNGLNEEDIENPVLTLQQNDLSQNKRQDSVLFSFCFDFTAK